jgi:indolepyruvate decarboxylase
MEMKETIGNFLLRRLDEAGVRHTFGVAGDYNVEFTQQLEDRGAPVWIGTCNELNGSYAADGYARIRGLSAMVVTYGVGALSAINGITGAYCEHVPVICICGSLPVRSLERREMMHHSLADGGRGNYYRMFAEVTAAQAEISPENAVVEIDRLILTAWRRKLPVYLELPSDIAYIEIDTPDEPLRLTLAPSSPERLQACMNVILSRLHAAKNPAFLLDLDADRFGVLQQVNRLAEKLQMPVAVMNTCKAGFAGTSPLFAGVYLGSASADATRRAVEESDCLLAIGLRRVEATTAFFSDTIPPSAIHLRGSSVNIGLDNYQAVSLPELLDGLIERSEPASAQRTPIIPPSAAAPAPTQAALTQAYYWKALEKFIRPDDVIIADIGTSNAGATEARFPPGCSFLNQQVYGSIGYSVGALLGTLFAAPERRHILFVGDGSFQLTAQELSTILHHDLKPYIFLINNRGYTIERSVLGRNSRYNDVANWSYTDLPSAFCPETTAECYKVATEEELQRVLDAPHKGLVFVEALMDKDDAPVAMIRGAHGCANANFGPTGPQMDKSRNLQVPVPEAMG